MRRKEDNKKKIFEAQIDQFAALRCNSFPQSN